MLHIFVVISFTISGVLAEDPVPVIQSLSRQIGQVVLLCQEEMQFPDTIIREFLQYWNTSHVLTNNMQGCVAACVLNKLDVIAIKGHLNRKNFEALMSANEAGPVVTEALKDLLEQCLVGAMAKKKGVRSEDGCDVALQMIKCFRYGVFSLQWAPRVGAVNSA